MRDLSVDFASALQSDCIEPVVMCNLDFRDSDGGSLNLWDGVGSLYYSGVHYLGAGGLALVEPVREVTDTVASSVKLSFRCSNTLLNGRELVDIRQVQARGRAGTLSYGLLNLDTRDLIGVEQAFVGLIDEFRVRVEPSSYEITLLLINRLVILNSSWGLLHTDSDQPRTSNFEDTSHRFIASIQDKTINI